ncbi:MAG: enoyl-CoA hydratase/isomerase family protein [Ilumatobacteraceae bacterium]
MRTHEDLIVELGDDHVGTIVVDRGPDNYIDVGLAHGIADALENLEADLGCRSIVLASSGKHFCAGARLSPAADDLPVGDSNPLYDAVARMFTGSVPIVAAVQGAAIGAGLGLALAADFRVAGPEARFGATFARLGFHQGFGLSATLPRAVGEQRALEMLYTGKRVKADEALAIGLCDRLVEADADGLRAAARELAVDIAASAPLAVRAIRRTMRGALADQVRAATDREHAEQQVLRRTEDYREGVAATAERRTPRFTGR